ncbi:N-acetylmuramoyl-L-alanine amidase [Sutterella sp.]|uniref:N-acetylmuramoyl-L-alanine amidase n=1 Tax=Sutterella sp. TaxID=1981025 RepID=UPI0026DFFA84|nr:N-acetylmuramoyl-L-alanine amidase [Sutterella sp.]MDO5530606.1 N-acetylmuramoyl-L-alanine amidase [Sutterella sp.]
MDADRRRLIAASGGLLLFSLAPWEIASGAKLVNVRMWPAEEYTRVTIETDVPLKYKHFFLRATKPLRLVIDIEGLALTESIRKAIADVKADDPYIKAMRIGQFKPGVLRLVMDLKTDVKPEVFSLKPFANYQHRLVFDIYPAHPKDAIGEILAGGDDGAAANDPLADVLADLANDEGGKERPAGKPAEKPSQSASSRGTKKPAGGKKPVPKKDNSVVIVIDPGHGGEDPGAIGRRRTQEKTVVLQIARRLAKLVSAEPGMKAVLTRNSDHFVSLGGRVAIARRVRAHLLVSIHADAWTKSTARGSSVFALSQRGATSAAARWLAKSQNESDLIGGVNIATVNKQVASVIVDMTSSWTIGYSLGLGSRVLGELKTVNRLHKNSVEQAGFAVLKGQGIPSILVETAFISNPAEEQLLKNGAHQQKLARAILNGIKKQLAADTSLTRQG